MIRAVGIDFGTTNSTVAIVGPDGVVTNWHWPTATGVTDLFRTALFFWNEGRPPRATLQHVAGPDALDKALAGTGEGRFLQSIKTHLGSRSLSETRLFGQRFTIEGLVATFLRALTAQDRTAIETGALPIVSGRPVVFAGDRPDDALATGRLQDAYRQAGLGSVALAFEPLGAAYWYARTLKRDETVLVADFGGGTSDFSVIRFTRGARKLDAEPLGHAGVGIAGDTFDYRLVDHLVSPQFGKGSLYRSFDKRLPFPAYLHAAFAQWHQLSWLKTPAVLAELQKLAKVSEAPDAVEKLIAFLDLDLGFELYQAIGAMKTRLSSADRAELDFSAHGMTLRASVTRADFERFIAGDLARIATTLDEALAAAGCRTEAIDAVFLTGGTSYVPAVRRIFAERFGPDRLHSGHAFQSVSSGLALLAADRGPVNLPSQTDIEPGRSLQEVSLARHSERTIP